MTSKEVIDTLEEIKGSISDNRARETRELLNKLSQLYGQAGIDESAAIKRSVLAHNAGGVSEDSKKAFSQYTAKATSVQAQRAKYLITGGKYVSDINVDLDDYIVSTDQLRSAEQSLLELARSADEIEVPRTLPASTQLVGTSLSPDIIPKNRESSIDVTIENVGDETAQDVGFEFMNNENISFSSSLVNIGRLNSRKTRTIKLTGLHSGEYTLELEVNSGGKKVDYEFVPVKVLNKQDFITTAKNHIDNSLQYVQNSDLSNSFQAKLTSADMKLSDAIKFIDKESPNKVNNMLTAASQILQALINQLGGSQNSINDKIYLEQQVEAALDAISRAKKSDL